MERGSPWGGNRKWGQKSLSITQIKIIIDTIESITTRMEYLTSRQVTSCESGDLVKRNLNFSPFRETATFCHPFKISLRIKMNKRTSIAILSPLKVCISAKSFCKKESGDLKVRKHSYESPLQCFKMWWENQNLTYGYQLIMVTIWDTVIAKGRVDK